jgi:hypothetical protein
MMLFVLFYRMQRLMNNREKTLRNALKKWGQTRYVPENHKRRMIGIRKKWAINGRFVKFRYKGQPYSDAQLDRYITGQRAKGKMDEDSLMGLSSYSGGKSNMIIYPQLIVVCCGFLTNLEMLRNSNGNMLL